MTINFTTSESSPKHSILLDKHDIELPITSDTFMPITLPSLDSKGYIVQLWKCQKKCEEIFFGIIKKNDVTSIILSNYIHNGLLPQEIGSDFLNNIVPLTLRKWHLVVYNESIIVWPYLIAAGRDDEKSFNQKKIDSQKSHLTTLDCTAAWREEIKREVVKIKDSGTPFNHIREVKSAQEGLKNCIYRIRKDLHKNPSQEDRERLTKELSEASQLLDHSEGYIKSRTRKDFSCRDLPMRAFKETLQQTKLTDSYNATNPQKPVPAKGAGSGEIGGVACGVAYIEGLFDGPESLFENEHLFSLPMIDGNLPCSNEQLRQILRELAIGIYAHGTVPFFSLHFSQGNTDLFPVIHPAYQHTLIGRIIGMLDYFMKGYLNGGVFPEDFIDNWHKNSKWQGQEATALAQLINFEAYCKQHLKGQEATYSSSRALACAVQKMSRADQITGLSDDFSATLQDFAGFKNSFRIISKQNSFRKEGSVFVIDADFEVLYTIAPSQAYLQAKEHYERVNGHVPPSYGAIEGIYKAMSQQIHDHMVKLPLCREYFAMLGIINFFSSYFSTLKKHGKLPTLPPCEEVDRRGCPPLFPHLPLLTPMEESLKINHGKCLEEFLQNPLAIKCFRSLLLDGDSCDSQNAERLLKINVENNISRHCSPAFKLFLKENKRTDQFIDDHSKKFFDSFCQRIKEIRTILQSKKPGWFRDNLRPEFWESINKDLLSCFPDKIESITKEFSYSTLAILSGIPSTKAEKTHRVVGGCGMRLEKSTLNPAPQVEQGWKKHHQQLLSLKPETFQKVEMGSLGECVVFCLPLEEVSPEAQLNYSWMESSLLLPAGQTDLSTVQERIQIEDAIRLGDRRGFLSLIAATSNLLQLRQRNGASLLHIAATFQDLFFVDTLLRNGFSPLDRDLDGYHPIHYAAGSGHIENMRLLLEVNRSVLNGKSYNGASPLIVAIQANQVQAVRFLLEHHPLPSLLTTGYTDLHCALHQGSAEIIRMLLQERAVVSAGLNEKPLEGGTALMIACGHGDFEIVEELLKLGADPATALESAVQSKSLPILRLLLQRTQPTPIALEMAAIKGTKEVMEYLISLYPPQNYTNSSGDNLLHIALRHSNIPVALYLCRFPFLGSQINKECDTPMCLAIFLGMWEVVEALSSYGIMPDLEDLVRVPYRPFVKQAFSHVTPSKELLEKLLFIALEAKNYLVISEVLIPKGASLNSVCGPKGWLAIHYLAKADAIFLFGQELIKSKDLLMRLEQDNRQTLPYIAAKNRSVRVFSLLLKEMNTHNISLENHYNDRHLFYAVIESGSVEMVIETLERFPSLINCPLDDLGTTSIHLASRLGLYKIASVLMERGALIDQKDKLHHKPLYYALRSLNEKIVKEILEKSPDVEGIHLFMAAKMPSDSFLKQFMKTNPAQNILDQALLYAVNNYHREAYSILCKWGADPLNIVSKLPTPMQKVHLQALQQLHSVQGVNINVFLGAIKSRDFEALSKAIETINPTQKIFVGYQGKLIWGTSLLLILRMLKEETNILPVVAALLRAPGQDFQEVDSEGNTISHLLVLAGISLTIHPRLPLATCNRRKQTPLHLAAGFASKDELQKLFVRLSPNDQEPLDENGSSPIFYAIEKHNFENLTFFIRSGQNLNIRSHGLATPLMLACKHGSLTMVRLLVENGADTNQSCTEANVLPLSLISLVNNREIFFSLVKYGAQIDRLDCKDHSFIHQAAQKGDIELVRLLEARGASLDMTDSRGMSTKHHAASKGHVALLEAISETKEESFDIPTLIGSEEAVTPLHVASLHGQVETVRWLLGAGSDIEAKTGDGKSVLAMAAGSNAAISLYEVFAPYKIAHNFGAILSAIPEAILKDNVSAISLLYGERFSTNSILNNKNTGLHVASTSGAVQCTKWLLAHGADPFLENHERKTAFELASVSSSGRQLQYLLEETGIDSDFYFHGKTLMHMAVQAGAMQQVIILVALGADINLFDQIRGMAPLHIAVEKRNYKIVALLLACGANSMLPTRDGLKSLEMAQEVDAELTEIFKYHHKIVDEAQKGSTLLHLAVLSRNPLAVMALAQISDLSELDAKGRTALDLAIVTEQFNLCRTLKKD